MQAEAEDFSDRERQGTFQLDIIEKELKHAEAHKKAILPQIEVSFLSLLMF